MKGTYFYEKQRFTQWWLWLLLAVIGISIYKPIYTAISEGKNLSGDQWFGILVLSVVILLMVITSLETRIDEDGIYVKFFPFSPNWKQYSWNMMNSVKVRKYSPIMEYGGWGWRYGANGKAYNMKGNKGLQLTFKNGSGLLIGTQKAEEMMRVLGKLDKYKFSE